MGTLLLARSHKAKSFFSGKGKRNFSVKLLKITTWKTKLLGFALSCRHRTLCRGCRGHRDPQPAVETWDPVGRAHTWLRSASSRGHTRGTDPPRSQGAHGNTRDREVHCWSGASGRACQWEELGCGITHTQTLGNHWGLQVQATDILTSLRPTQTQVRRYSWTEEDVWGAWASGSVGMEGRTGVTGFREQQGRRHEKGRFFNTLGFSSHLNIKSEPRNKTRATYSRTLDNMEERAVCKGRRTLLWGVHLSPQSVRQYCSDPTSLLGGTRYHLICMLIFFRENHSISEELVRETVHHSTPKVFYYVFENNKMNIAYIIMVLVFKKSKFSYYQEMWCLNHRTLQGMECAKIATYPRILGFGQVLPSCV